jgi:hypothetical protein
MKQEKSTHRGNLPMSEENLIQVLESFQPIPSSSFYNRTQKAPWTSRYRITRYAFQAAILMAFIVIIYNKYTNINAYFRIGRLPVPHSLTN